MQNMNIEHNFEDAGTSYRMDILHVSDKPLVFRYQFQKKVDGQWENVAYDDREYDDPSGLGVKDDRIPALLQSEAPLMANEFLEYLRKKAARKKKKK
ncbi:MAG: hypothetical protein ACTHN5_09530 [Phycisphaerae bacterium]